MHRRRGLAASTQAARAAAPYSVHRRLDPPVTSLTSQEARALKAAGEIPEHITINDAAVEPSGGADEAGGFEFGDDSDSSSDEDAGAGKGGALDVDAI